MPSSAAWQQNPDEQCGWGGFMPERIQTPNAPAPIGPYAQAIRANGFIFVSGQIPIDPQSNAVIRGDIEFQTRQVLKNLSAILEAAGSGLRGVVMTTIYMANLDDFPRFNQVYSEFFGEVQPARATVQVDRLPKEVLVEIAAIALDQIAF
jgi:2-iminobutanoate/2-iminopropanoate deaminase